MQTPEPIETFLYHLVWIIVVPAIVIGFIISIIWPGLRLDISDILVKGLFMLIALATAYFLGVYLKDKK